MEETKPSFWKKFCAFWIKWHLQYLALAGLLYGLKAALYFIIAYASDATHAVTFNMEIDKHIPVISYFYFFYLGYYILPEIFMWILSFYDKKKLFTIVLAVAAANVLACVCFMIQQVKMIRPEAEMAAYSNFSSVYNLDTFFKWAIDKQYKADETALNCFPSLHASMGMALATIGIWTGKDENHFPLWMRIFCGVFGVGIVMSTFFVKQHYFIDAIAGAGLFFALYWLFKLVIVPFYLKKREQKLQNQNSENN